MQQLLLFGTPNSHAVFYINTDEQEMQRRKYELQLPFDYYGNEYFAVLSYQYILFLILKTGEKVYCLDLLKKKWYQSNKGIDMDGYHFCNWEQIVKVGEDTVYIIQCSDNDYSDAKQCTFTISLNLSDIMPDELLIRSKLRYRLLIYGFLQCIKNIPHDLISLIAQFYSSFG